MSETRVVMKVKGSTFHTRQDVGIGETKRRSSAQLDPIGSPSVPEKNSLWRFSVENVACAIPRDGALGGNVEGMCEN